MLLLAKGHAQTPGLSKADSVAIATGKADSLSIADLTYRLTAPFDDPVLKTRAIFTWIAYNISYDCPAYHNESKRKGDPDEIFRTRKGVCEGYANLFQTMCSYAQVQCLTIDGYARNGADIYEDDPDEPNHTWNAVRINGAWHLADATWASGYTDKRVKVFTQHFSDVYFFPAPEAMLLNHYPKLDSWRLCKVNVSKKGFFQHPAVSYGFLKMGGASFDPVIKKINVKKGSPLNFSITFRDAALIHRVTLLLGEDKKAVQFDPPIEKKDNSISFSIKYDKPGAWPLTIYINDLPALTYQLETAAE